MSGPGFRQELRQAQQMVLAPQLRQSLKILQVAALDLRATIQQEIESNPTLEELPMDTVSLDEEKDREEAGEGGAEDGREPVDFSKEFEILSKIDQDWRDHLSQAGGGEHWTGEDDAKRQHFLDSLTGAESLPSHLLEQAQMSDCSPGVQAALRYLIGSLDDRGFLTGTPADLALYGGLPLADVQEALRLLRTFDPPGIGAQNAADCLILQLEAKGRGESLAVRILRDHFELLTRRRIPDIARLTGTRPDDVEEAVREIATLDPAPGRRFAADSNQVVVPDVTVEKQNGEWVVIMNRDCIPRLRVNPVYKDMLARPTLTKAERDYLSEQIRSGRFLIGAIEQRQQTIERITRELLVVQRDFFEEGVGRLHPLTMTQVAGAVGVHETTVSRAIANKFIRTPHGVFDFKFFFTTGYQSSQGEAVSNRSVKDMIASIVASEDSAHPLSDQDIVGRLRSEGIDLARRTVAKYREELGILPSNLRRSYK